MKAAVISRHGGPEVIEIVDRPEPVPAAGEWVLIQAAGSGVSHAAIQIAKLAGARVIATSSTPEKIQHARRFALLEQASSDACLPAGKTASPLRGGLTVSQRGLS
jgi:NADPH:quinone reductase-like Zn-dependent oxidoreductase